MKTRMLAGLLFALLAAHALVAQVGAMPDRPLWLEITGSTPLASGEVFVLWGDVISLKAFFTPNGSIQDFALLATTCGPGTTMCWELLAMGPVPPDQLLACDGVVPNTGQDCSFMLVLAGHDGMGWWYVGQPLVVHVCGSPPSAP